MSAYRCDADCGETALAEVHANELVEAAPAWFAQQTDIAIIGSKPPWLSAAMQGKFVADVFPSARAMVSMARQCHAEGGSETAERALPMYISGDSPWHKSTTGVVLPAS